MNIKKIEKSKLESIDVDNLIFGSNFTDHMAVCDFKDGKWSEPKILPYSTFDFDPSAQVFHYGQAVFEGMKAYKDKNGDAFLFRPNENQMRINKSAKRLHMAEVPAEIFNNCLQELVSLDKDWIPTELGKSLYLRPFIIATEPKISARPSTMYRFAIICSPAGHYYGQPLKVKIADHYSRSASGGVGFAKAAGNYAGSFYPTYLAQNEGFDQVVWTDSNSHKYIEEAGTMNVFVRFNDTLYTAPISDRILDGITRKSLIQLAKDNGYKIVEENIEVSRLIEGIKDGLVKEAFGCGTAVTVNSIAEFGYKGDNYIIKSDGDSFSEQLKKLLFEIQYNISNDPYNWRVKVK